MEWRAGEGPDLQSVIVPNELVAAILKVLQETGVALDPYRDKILGNEGARRIAEALAKFCDHRRVKAEDSVKRRLGVHALPAWAEKIVAERAGQDQLMTVCASLKALCELALARNVGIEVLGQ